MKKLKLGDMVVAVFLGTSYECKVIEIIDKGFEDFKPRESYDFYKVEEVEPNYIKHKLFDYSYE